MTNMVAPSRAEWSAVALVSTLLIVALPIVIIAYYVLRLSLRRKALIDVLLELSLDREFLRLYDGDSWKGTQGKSAELQQQAFRDAFNSQWRGDTRAITYAPPLLLLILTTIFFVSIVLIAWLGHTQYKDLLQYPVLFAMGGAFVYVYPQLIRRYGSLTLNPQVVYELLGILWISVLTGVVAALVAADPLKIVAAFVGSLAPVPTLLFLRDKLQTKQSPDEVAAAAERTHLLGLVGGDEDLVSQLGYIGVRSIRALASENPIRVFAEVDPNLALCLELVDRANLWQWVPDEGKRVALNELGVRTAVDLMTQAYEYLPPPGKIDPEWRFVGPSEPLPAHMGEPFDAFRLVLGHPNVDVFRNMLAMMSEEPQLVYLQQLWARMNESLEAAFP